MEILIVLAAFLLGAVIIIGFGTFFYYYVVVWGALFLHNFWPTVLGVILCVFLWRSGLDNIGVLFAIAGVVGDFYWLKSPLAKKVNEWLERWLPLYKDSFEPSASKSMAGKIARYDKDGKVVGYQDREN